MSSIKNYLSLIKFSHTIFAMPFAMIGFVLAVSDGNAVYDLSWYPERSFPFVNGTVWGRLLLVVACMVFARSAAMAFNRYLDKQFDARNPRTAIREIPAGIIKANHALLFTVVCCIAFVVCCYFINRLCFYLSFVALFVILFYSYTKRFTALCHLVLGVGLSLAPIGAYLAVTGKFNSLPIVFSVIVMCWVSGFDIIYALQDENFDRENRLHSIPAALGKVKALRVSGFLHVLAAGMVITAGLLGDFHGLYWTGAALFCGMLFYQHTLVKPDDLSRVNLAFMTANGIASVVFAVFVILDLLIMF